MKLRKPAKAGFSPQARSARNRSAITKQRIKGFAPIGADTNFLLTCSDSTLAAYELARLGAIADLRADLQEILDQLIDTTAQAALIRWFRNTDREALKRALETPVDPIAIAKEQIRRLGRSEEEVEAELEQVLSLNPGLAHRTAAVTYQKRNIAEGKCMKCPKPLDRNSVSLCTEHLRDARVRYKPIGSAAPGSIDFLYADADALHSRHGRQPGTLASLAMAREQKSRALLAELGIPPESAAVSVKAAKEAIVKCLPEMKGIAKTPPELMVAAAIPVKITAERALHELLAAGTVERTGEGKRGDPFRYFLAGAEKREETRKPIAAQTKAKNRVLLQTLRGDKSSGE